MHFLIVLLFIVYFTDIFQFFEISGYGVNLIDFTFLALFLVFLKRIIWDGEEMKFTYHPALIFFILLLSTSIISGIVPLVKGETIQITQYIKTTIHFLFLTF